MTRSVVLRVACAALVFLFSGCALLRPRVEAKNPPVNTPTELTVADAYAIDLAEKYYDAADHYSLFNRSAGILIIGAAAAALAIGINGGSSEAIAGLGAGGAGVLGIHQLIYSRNYPRIYDAGAGAIHCTRGLFAKAGSISEGEAAELQDLLAEFPKQLETLDKGIKGLQAETREDVSVKEAESVLARGRVTLDRGRAAANRLRFAAADLYNAVEAIRAQVNKALEESEPDVQQIAAGLGTSLPGYYASVTPKLEKGEVTGKSGRINAADKDKLKAALAQARVVEEAAGRIEKIVSHIGEAPSESDVAKCKLDAASTGLTFRLDPSGTVFVDTTSDKPTGVLVASGGKPPYHANWIGDVPNEASGIKKAVDHDAAAPGEAAITIEAPKAAPAHTYRLRVSDEGGGRGTVWVQVGNAPVSGAAPSEKKPSPTQPPLTSAPVTPPKPAASDEVKALQKRLQALKCLPEGDAAVTGIFDGATENALRAMLQVVGEPSQYDDVFKENGKLSARLVRETLGKAEAAGVACPGS